ncbi:hypothetical protein ACFOSC_23720 [Streptantibioticus rubrisoli]|uniref:Secreted protein n=1 Tax=Streptantibioticus rubrisoli TaxID=1387313 RepID=A0ABT1PHB0_9ACTN|nr:hypothetical protein [Streptantibioticus rubrisoli]MCQ4043893.1 hypothetical protein [Streptantibioticus rubrisoli]
MTTRHHRGLRARAAALLLAAAALTTAGTADASAAAAAPAAPGGWVETGSGTVNSLTGGEGLATRADGSVLYRGLGSIPLALRIQGWNHVGDPDIARGDIFDAYQGGSNATSKMFAVTTPSGQRYEYTHPLDPGEMLNNSFAAVSPDAQWLVSGEWGDENRLQVFPAPLLNPATPPTGGNLPQAGQITLDRTVNDIQGCDFVSPTRLLCSSDDPAKDLFQVDLPRPLDGTRTTGHVTTLFQLPQRSICTGSFETEGIDYDPNTRLLRVEVISPGICKVATGVYEYRPTTD